MGGVGGGGVEVHNEILFWAQMALASLVAISGRKKSRFLGPTPSNAPRNDVAHLKTITYHTTPYEQQVPYINC
jgi:hypothetical protein